MEAENSTDCRQFCSRSGQHYSYINKFTNAGFQAVLVKFHFYYSRTLPLVVLPPQIVRRSLQ